jgi:hypothetical protein
MENLSNFTFNQILMSIRKHPYLDSFLLKIKIVKFFLKINKESG